jgi:hypothetical protein
MQQPATFRRVKYLALLALATLTGCQTHYTRLVVTDFTGVHISTWIAEGPVKKHELGYRIRAVERTSGGAYPTTSRYANGWSAVVAGPNITQEEVPKPAWLEELDDQTYDPSFVK